MAQLQKQQDVQEFDYVKLLFHCAHYWYWFVLCVAVCIGLAILYVQTKTNVYSVSSTIMIRTDNNMSRSSLQTDMMELMGYQTSKIIGDEIQIIASHNIMEQVVRALNLQTEYRKKVGLRWVGQYPNPDVLLSFESASIEDIGFLELELQRTETDYVLILNYHDEEFVIHANSLQEPIQTPAGVLRLTEMRVLKVGDKMRITQLLLSRYSVLQSSLKKRSYCRKVSGLSFFPTDFRRCEAKGSSKGPMQE